MIMWSKNYIANKRVNKGMNFFVRALIAEIVFAQY